MIVVVDVHVDCTCVLVCACAFLVFFVCLFVYNPGSDLYLQIGLSFNGTFNMMRLQHKKGLNTVNIKMIIAYCPYIVWVEYRALL